jgi:hypothetical protein
MLETVETVHRAALLSRRDVIVEAASTGRVQLPRDAQDAASGCAVVSDTLGAASQTEGCDWDFYGPARSSPGEDPESLTLARAAAGCLVIEGNRLLASGDVQAAIERYVQTLRIGADLRRGDLGMYISGLSIAGMAIERLAELMSSSDASGIASHVAEGVPALAPNVEEFVGAVETERLKGWARASAYEAPERFVNDGWWSRLAWKGLAILVPRKAIGAYFLTSRREPIFRALAGAVAIEDPMEAAVQLRKVLKSAQGVSHPLVNTEVSAWARVRVSHDDLLARFRLVVAAAKLEQLQPEAGSYPSDGSALELPIDPFAWPRTIQYQALSQGQRYRLWSVGPDLVDEHGRADDRKDLVLERTSQ